MPAATDRTIDPKRLAALAELAWRLYPHVFAEKCRLQSPGGAFKSTRLSRFLGTTIADAVFATGARVIVNVAPRQGKSEVCSFATPTWFLDNFPGRRVVLASYAESLALEFGRRVRNEFADNPLLRTRLSDDSQAANRWNTPEGGGMKTVGVGGGITGFGGDLIVVDDPHKDWAEAHSPTVRRRVQEWFVSTLMNRLEPGGSVVIVMQRWHPDDLTGYLLRQAREPWKVIRLPALAGPNDPMGRKAGEAVCPERFPREAMEAIRDSRPKAVWDANYDQDPQASGDGRVYGSFVRADHVKADVRLRDDLPLQLAFDFNSNPGVHCLLGQYDRRADLLTARHEVFADRADTPRTMKALKLLLDRIGAFENGRFRWGVCEVYGDRSGRSPTTVTADTDYTVILAALRQWGVPTRFKVQNANPSIKDRLMSVNDALRDSSGRVHYLIHPDCQRLVRDYEEVMGDEQGLPDKDRDADLTHPSDAEGYRIWYQRPAHRISVPTSGRVAVA